jgi:hypothetical protein
MRISSGARQVGRGIVDPMGSPLPRMAMPKTSCTGSPRLPAGRRRGCSSRAFPRRNGSPPRPRRKVRHSRPAGCHSHRAVRAHIRPTRDTSRCRMPLQRCVLMLHHPLVLELGQSQHHRLRRGDITERAHEKILHQLEAGDRFTELQASLHISHCVLVGSELAADCEPGDACSRHAQDLCGIRHSVTMVPVHWSCDSPPSVRAMGLSTAYTAPRRS